MENPDLYILQDSIFRGQLNTQRVAKIKKLAENTGKPEWAIRDYFGEGAKWGIEICFDELQSLRKENKGLRLEYEKAELVHVHEGQMDRGEHYEAKKTWAKITSLETQLKENG